MTSLLGRFSLWHWLTVASILSFIGRSVPAQVVNIPDPQLEAAIRTAINKPSGPITVTDMQSMTNLPASGRAITNLTGLDKATNLRTNDLGFNQVSDLTPITGLTNLTQFIASWNRITNLGPLAGLTNLIWLDLAGNRGPSDSSITNISALANLKQLKWLSLFYLRVNDIQAITNLTALTNLDVNFNYGPIASTPGLSRLTNLVLLNIAADRVGDISFVTSMPWLRHLDMGNDNVTNLSPVAGTQLTE